MPDRQDVLNWLRDYDGTVPFLESVRDQYRNRDYLSHRQYQAVERNYIRMVEEGQEDLELPDPAEADDQPLIRNGVYAVNAESTTLEFQLYTATQGSLVGKRLVKRMVDGRWKAFGFLTKEGELRLWQRYIADEGMLYVKHATLLVGLLRRYSSTFDEAIYQATVNGEFAAQAVFHASYTEALGYPQGATITLAAQCRHCNRLSRSPVCPPVSDEIDGCSTTAAEAIRATSDAAYHVSTRISREVQRERAARQEQEREERLEREREAREQLEAAIRDGRIPEGTNLTLSQLGTGEVQ